MELIKWKFDNLFKGDAAKCYAECQELSEITPENVLNKARNEDTELHRCIEWDDSVASEKYRLIQARDIIRSIVIVTPEKEEQEPVKIRTFQISSETNVYKPTRVFLQEPDEYKTLLKRAKEELAAFRQRYKMLSELEAIFAEIDLLEG